MRFIHWVCRVIKWPEACIMPRWLQFIAYLLYPTRAMMDLNPWFKVNYERDTFTYHGVEISFRLLDSFTRMTEPGYALTITREKNGIVTIQKILLKGDVHGL